MSRGSHLRSLILKAKHAYCYSGESVVGDAEFDALEDELRRLSPDDPVLAMVGAHAPADAMLTKARHAVPMGSQSKVNSEDEFRTWCARGRIDAIHISLKGDGASAAAYYRGGQLIQAISRGDGTMGEDFADVVAHGADFRPLGFRVRLGVCRRAANERREEKENPKEGAWKNLHGERETGIWPTDEDSNGVAGLSSDDPRPVRNGAGFTGEAPSRSQRRHDFAHAHRAEDEQTHDERRVAEAAVDERAHQVAPIIQVEQRRGKERHEEGARDRERHDDRDGLLEPQQHQRRPGEVSQRAEENAAGPARSRARLRRFAAPRGQ